MITPEELQADRDATAKEQMAALIKAVDETLRARFEGYGHAVSVSWPNGTKRHVIEHVRDLYGQNGWSVRIVHDQRDGDYLEFKAVKPSAEPMPSAYDREGRRS